VKVYIQISNTTLDEILLKGPIDLIVESFSQPLKIILEKKYGDTVPLKDHLNVHRHNCAAKLMYWKLHPILKHSE
jgi:hypothetical protein